MSLIPKLTAWLVLAVFCLVATSSYAQNSDFSFDSYYKIQIAIASFKVYNYHKSDDSYYRGYQSRRNDTILGIGYGKRIIAKIHGIDFYGEANLDITEEYYIAKLGLILDILFSSKAISLNYHRGLGFDMPDNRHAYYKDHSWEITHATIGIRYISNKHYKLELGNYQHHHNYPALPTASKLEIEDEKAWVIGVSYLFF